jgi:hypothetical protein
MTDELTDQTPVERTPQPPAVKKKKRGRPKGTRRVPRKAAKPVEQIAPEEGVVNIDLSRDTVLAETILETQGYTDEDVDRIVLGLENQGNAYDWVRNMDEFRLPGPLQKLADEGKQAFRWIDSNDDTCMIQIHRDNFRWTPVNVMSHGKYFKPNERRIRFNKHGGIMSGYMLLCWMPGKLYDAWCGVKGKMARSPSALDKSNKPPGVTTYDPVAEGSAAAGANAYATEEKFTGVVDVMNDTHPDTSYEESGEYT